METAAEDEVAQDGLDDVVGLLHADRRRTGDLPPATTPRPAFHPWVEHQCRRCVIARRGRPRVFRCHLARVATSLREAGLRARVNDRT